MPAQGKEGVKGLQTCAQGSGCPCSASGRACGTTMNCGGLPGLGFVLLSCKGIILCNFAANCSSIWALRVVSVLFLSRGFWRRSGEVQLCEPEVCAERINRSWNKALNERIYYKGDALGRASLPCPRAALPHDPAGVHYRNQKAAGLAWADCQSSSSKALCQSFLRKHQNRDVWERRSLPESVSDERGGGNSCCQWSSVGISAGPLLIIAVME